MGGLNEKSLIIEGGGTYVHQPLCCKQVMHGLNLEMVEGF